MIKYYIEVVNDDGTGEYCLLETKRFDTREKALDWYYTSFVKADVWECVINLVSVKGDESGLETLISYEGLRGIQEVDLWNSKNISTL